MAITPGLMTADDLLRLPDDGLRHELVRGELRTAPLVGFQQGVLCSKINGSLGGWACSQRRGTVVVGVGFVLTFAPDTVRCPDVAFVRQDRLAGLDELRGYFPGAPDIL